MGKKKSTKIKVPLSLLPQSQQKQHISGTIIFDGHKFRLKSRTGDFTLLPQGRVFICFSGNTSEEVLSVQNELLLENLRPNQIIEWQPLAWNAVGNVCSFGHDGNAQNVLDTFADNAEHIVFVVKDKIYDGLLHEWELWTSNPQGKKIYLFIYDNDKKAEIHNQLDPSKNIIYFSYKTSSDILSRLIREIQPALELSLESHKLSFISTASALKTYREELKNKITELKATKHIDLPMINGLEKHLQFVEYNQDQIINQNKKIMVDVTVERTGLGRFIIKPIHVNTPSVILVETPKQQALNIFRKGRGAAKTTGRFVRKGVISPPTTKK